MKTFLVFIYILILLLGGLPGKAFSQTPMCTADKLNPAYIFIPNLNDYSAPIISLSKPFTVAADNVGDSTYAIGISDKNNDTGGDVLSWTDNTKLSADGKTPINNQKSQNGRVQFNIDPTGWSIDTDRDYYVRLVNTLSSPPGYCNSVKVNFTRNIDVPTQTLPPAPGVPKGLIGYGGPPPSSAPTVGPLTPQCPNGECLSGLGFSLPTDPAEFVKTIFGIILSLAGGIAIILIMVSGYGLMFSGGNPEKVQSSRDQLAAAIVGLLFIIFSMSILQIIGVDILHIPGLTK